MLWPLNQKPRSSIYQSGCLTSNANTFYIFDGGYLYSTQCLPEDDFFDSQYYLGDKVKVQACPTV